MGIIRIMDNPYAALIAQERDKIAALRLRIAAIEDRIRVLESLVPDELDDALTRAILEARAKAEARAAQDDLPAESDSPVVEPIAEELKLPSSEKKPPVFILPNDVKVPEQLKTPEASVGSRWQFKMPSRRLPLSTLLLLDFLSGAPKSREEMLGFMRKNSFESNSGALSTFVYNYRKHFGFVDVDHAGNTFLTDRGAQYLREHASEMETPTPAATDAGVDSQQADGLPKPEGTEPGGGN